jgi:hypothetical protein
MSRLNKLPTAHVMRQETSPTAPGEIPILVAGQCPATAWAEPLQMLWISRRGVLPDHGGSVNPRAGILAPLLWSVVFQDAWSLIIRIPWASAIRGLPYRLCRKPSTSDAGHRLEIDESAWYRSVPVCVRGSSECVTFRTWAGTGPPEYNAEEAVCGSRMVTRPPYNKRAILSRRRWCRIARGGKPGYFERPL